MRYWILLLCVLMVSCAQQQQHVTVHTDEGRTISIAVEVADEPAERELGLMNRNILSQDAGMLFVFDDERYLSFWMRNTSIPLSIAYIAANGTIIDIQNMEPFNETPITSVVPAKYALEVNQGFFYDVAVETGDRIDLP